MFVYCQERTLLALVASVKILGSAPRRILHCVVAVKFSSVMAIDRITVRGARQHNLKNIDVEIPREKLTVITGLSGSGKSSLAFDTIYAEGQRRYVESLSAYARQFLDQLEKPDVDSVDRRALTCHIDRTKNDDAQPPLHRRDGYGSL